MERLSECPRSHRPCAEEAGAEPKDVELQGSCDYFSIPETDSPKAAQQKEGVLRI